MRGALSLAALAATLLSLSLPSARAEDGDHPIDPARQAAFDTRIFGKPVAADNAYACFARRYDTDHLARHPQQKVAAMKLLVSAEKSPDDGAETYSFTLNFNYRHRKANFDSSGSCRHVVADDKGGEIQLGCGVDCDGGGIAVALADDDKSTLVSLERIRIWQKDRPDEETHHELVAGADDKSFRLQRVALRDCDALMPDRKTVASTQP